MSEQAMLRRDARLCLAACALCVGLLLVGACQRERTAPQLGSPAAPVATSPPNNCAAGQRPFTVTNNHTQPVWLGVTAGTISCLSDADCPTGAAGACQGANPQAGAAGRCTCTGGSGCGTIAQCNSSNNNCYWNLPTVGQINLPPKASTTVCFPATAGGQKVQWSGNIFARTGCDQNGQNCQTGECGNQPNQLCPVGQGGNPPVSVVEFTLNNQAAQNPQPDFYDVSIINGVNVGASMTPNQGTFQSQANNPYFCGAPGSQTTTGSLSPCTWQFTPTVGQTNYATILRNVLPQSFTGGKCPDGSKPNSLNFCACTSDAACTPAGALCGLALNASSTKFTQVCGAAIGWWTADEICGAANGAGSPDTPAALNCNNNVKNSDGSTSTYTNFYACTKPANANNGEQAQSCYNASAVVDCCGCATSKNANNQAWPKVVSMNGPDNGCYNNNPRWVQIAQPWLVFLKQACPTAYVYQYDDATSTFTCTGNGGAATPAYTVAFFSTSEGPTGAGE